MISKAVVVGAYQRKLEELAAMPNMDLTVLVPPSWRDSRGATRLERVFTQGYRLVETPIVLNGHFHTHFYPRLAEDLAAANPDLVHVDEEPYNVAAWQAIRWASRRGLPALFFTWQNLHRRYPPPFSWIEHYNHGHAACAIAGNQEARQILLAKQFAKPIHVIPQFGVDPELFSAAGSSDHQILARPEQKPGLVVGYAGGLVPEKGVDILLRAVAVCNQQLTGGIGHTVPPIACRVRIAGAGPEQAKLEALAQQLGQSSHVTLVGRLSSTDMPAFYRTLDIVVLPSRTMPNWKEQFGRVLVEAMASGAAVVGSDSGEIPHVIGDAGLVFPEGDAEALAAILLQLACNPLLLAELRQRGRNRVLANYTQQRIAHATYEVYDEIMQASRAGLSL